MGVIDLKDEVSSLNEIHGHATHLLSAEIQRLRQEVDKLREQVTSAQNPPNAVQASIIRVNGPDQPLHEC